jgi:hypothetical protein
MIISEFPNIDLIVLHFILLATELKHVNIHARTVNGGSDEPQTTY